MRKIIKAIIAGAVLVALSSCVNEFTAEVGEIKFGVNTTYGNGPATKTEYSGKDQNNNSICSTSTKERINWLSTDKVRILCQQASRVSGSEKYDDYMIVLGAEGSDETHTASLAPLPNGLQWGTGDHDFYAVYPSAIQSNYSSIVPEGSGARIGGYIPSSQTATLDGHIFKPDMDFAYMYAVKTGVPAKGTVALDFKPLVTTLEFTLLTRDGNAITSNLTTVKLSSSQSGSKLAGDFVAHLTSSGLTPVSPRDITNGSNEIVLTLPGGGVQLSTTDAYTVTFLCLPLAQTELTLTLGFADGTVRTLELKDNDSWVTVEACKKTYIWKLDAPLSVGTYVFSVLEPDDLHYLAGTSHSAVVYSYRYEGEDIAANRTGIPWEVDGFYGSLSDAQNGTNAYSGISDTYLTDFVPISTTGAVDGESVTISYVGADGTEGLVDPSVEITDRIRSNFGAYAHHGSPDNYWNLANPVNGSRTSIKETGNTYIVNAPGYYCIPLVMGNGIKNNAYNTAAYKQQNFVNYKGNSLQNASSPLLQDQGGTPRKAFIVWSDGNLLDVKNTTDWEIANATGQSSCITTSTVRIGGSSKTIYWLNFHIKEEEVRQSDIVIAISDGSQVMWSYTLWITDYVPQDGRHGYDPDIDIADVEGTFNPQGGLVTFMPRNLGWVESGQTVGTTYAGESVFVRLKQQASDNFVVMHVARPEKTVVTGGDAGYSPYYCWGRKDPFIPSDGVNNGSNLGGLSGKYPTFQTVNDSGTIAKEYKQTILRPEVHLGFNSNWLHDQAGGNGFWCAGNTQTSVDKATVKTIYDPCPPGYTVPRYNAFLGLRIGTSGTTPNSYGGFTRGFYLWSHYRGSASESTNGMRYVFFSAAGYRSNQTGLTSKVNEYGGFWASIPNDNQYSEFLTISVDGTLNPQGRDLRSRGLSIRPTLDEYKN